MDRVTSASLSLRGQVVLVTGATGGLGGAVVERLLAAGASVAAVYRDEAKYRRLAGLRSGTAGRLDGFRADVTSDAEVRDLVDTVVGRHGRLDALVCLVGAYRGGAEVAATSDEDLESLLRANLWSVFLCARAVLPVMAKAGSGRIVTVGARPALEKKGRVKSGAYALSKAAVVVLTETIAEEYRRAGITANCVVPGTIDTAENRAAIPDGDFTKWADPADIAEVILFLVSDASAVTSGAAIPVYGKS
jgi:NAD(P)-dependent dehydrogenase (short-subunit alcohol dehydrogenase family)